MFDASCLSRETINTEGIVGVVSEQTKHTGIPFLGNSVVTDVQFGHLFLVCIKYVALQEVTCG